MDAVERRRKVLREKSILVLKEVLQKDPSPVIRHEAAFRLGASKQKKAIPFLIKAILEDDSDLVRHEAIEALGDLGFANRRVVSLLSRLRKDENPFIRDTAVMAFATLSKP